MDGKRNRGRPAKGAGGAGSGRLVPVLEGQQQQECAAEAAPASSLQSTSASAATSAREAQPPQQQQRFPMQSDQVAAQRRGYGARERGSRHPQPYQDQQRMPTQLQQQRQRAAMAMTPQHRQYWNTNMAGFGMGGASPVPVQGLGPYHGGATSASPRHFAASASSQVQPQVPMVPQSAESYAMMMAFQQQQLMQERQQIAAMKQWYELHAARGQFPPPPAVGSADTFSSFPGVFGGVDMGPLVNPNDVFSRNPAVTSASSAVTSGSGSELAASSQGQGQLPARPASVPVPAPGYVAPNPNWGAAMMQDLARQMQMQGYYNPGFMGMAPNPNLRPVPVAPAPVAVRPRPPRTAKLLFTQPAPLPPPQEVTECITLDSDDDDKGTAAAESSSGCGLEKDLPAALGTAREGSSSPSSSSGGEEGKNSAEEDGEGIRMILSGLGAETEEAFQGLNLYAMAETNATSSETDGDEEDDEEGQKRPRKMLKLQLELGDLLLGVEEQTAEEAAALAAAKDVALVKTGGESSAVVAGERREPATEATTKPKMTKERARALGAARIADLHRQNAAEGITGDMMYNLIEKRDRSSSMSDSDSDSGTPTPNDTLEAQEGDEVVPCSVPMSGTQEGNLSEDLLASFGSRVAIGYGLEESGMSSSSVSVSTSSSSEERSGTGSELAVAGSSSPPEFARTRAPMMTAGMRKEMPTLPPPESGSTMVVEAATSLEMLKECVKAHNEPEDEVGTAAGKEPDAITAGAEPDAFTAGAEPDAITAGKEPDAITAGKEPDAITAGAEPDAFTAGAEPDAFTAGAEPYAISAVEPMDVDYSQEDLEAAVAAGDYGVELDKVGMETVGSEVGDYLEELEELAKAVGSGDGSSAPLDDYEEDPKNNQNQEGGQGKDQAIAVSSSPGSGYQEQEDYSATVAKFEVEEEEELALVPETAGPSTSYDLAKVKIEEEKEEHYDLTWSNPNSDGEDGVQFAELTTVKIKQEEEEGQDQVETVQIKQEETDDEDEKGLVALKEEEEETVRIKDERVDPSPVIAQSSELELFNSPQMDFGSQAGSISVASTSASAAASSVHDEHELKFEVEEGQSQAVAVATRPSAGSRASTSSGGSSIVNSVSGDDEDEEGADEGNKSDSSSECSLLSIPISGKSTRSSALSTTPTPMAKFNLSNVKMEVEDGSGSSSGSESDQQQKQELGRDRGAERRLSDDLLYDRTGAGPALVHVILQTRLNPHLLPSGRKNKMLLCGPPHFVELLQQGILGMDNPPLEENIVIVPAPELREALEGKKLNLVDPEMVRHLVFMLDCDGDSHTEKMIKELRVITDTTKPKTKVDVYMCRHSGNKRNNYCGVDALHQLITYTGLFIKPFYYDQPRHVQSTAKYCTRRYETLQFVDIIYRRRNRE